MMYGLLNSGNSGDLSVFKVTDLLQAFSSEIFAQLCGI